eukprot:COSAG04_NODE_251_length_18828_cov_18.990923_14_plen_415_part_00
MVAAALRECGGAVRIERMCTDSTAIRYSAADAGDAEPASTRCRTLRVRRGLRTWRVCNLADASWRAEKVDDGATGASSAGVDNGAAGAVAGQQQGGASDAEPSERVGPWYATHEQAVAAGSAAPASFFPPALDDPISQQLGRCVRLLPHDNDSDGCFCAVLVKTAALPELEEQDDEEEAEQAALTTRGDFSVPAALRTLVEDGAPRIGPADAHPGWPPVRRFFDLDTQDCGLVFLTSKSGANAESGAVPELGPVFAATAAAVALAADTPAVVRVGALVLTAASARTAASQEPKASGAGQQGGSTHRLADGSAGWLLRQWAPTRVLQLPTTALLASLALGKLSTITSLGPAGAQLVGMPPGCIVAVAAEADAGLGLGLEAVVAWRTGGEKLMVFVSKPLRRLLSERCEALGIGTK